MAKWVCRGDIVGVIPPVTNIKTLGVGRCIFYSRVLSLCKVLFIFFVWDRNSKFSTWIFLSKNNAEKTLGHLFSRKNVQNNSIDIISPRNIDTSRDRHDYNGLFTFALAIISELTNHLMNPLIKAKRRPIISLLAH